MPITLRLSDADANLLAIALRIAATQFESDAENARLVAGGDRIAAQFSKQRDDALRLVDVVDSAEGEDE